MIEFDQVVRCYGQKVAVNGLTLTIPSGELFAFLGPNGAGKTTSIKMLAGLLRPTSGTVRVCGHDVVSESRAAHQLLGYVPDEPYLYDKLTGREFMQFIVDMYGIPRDESRSRIERQIAAFELGDFVDNLTESYSHGMKQRLVLAATVLHEPSVLVIDEPMVGLDPRGTKLVKDLLRNMAREGTTIFMSTHTLSMAHEIADRIGIIDHGRLRFLGTVEQLRDQMSQIVANDSSLEELFLEVTGESTMRGAQLITGRDERDA